MAKATEQVGNLRKWHLWLTGLYAVQAAALLLFSVNRSLPVHANFLTTDSLQTGITGHTVLAPAVQQLFAINLVYLLTTILVVGALAHLSLATWYRARYEADLKNGLNRLRWIEFAISGGLMLMTIALLAGMSDLGSLLMIWGLVAVASLLGLVTEAYNPWRRAMQVRWLSAIVALKAGFLPWLVIGLYLLYTNLYGAAPVPTYLYVLFGTVLLCFTGLAVTMYLQYRQKGRWADYYFTDRVYMILGTATAAILTWQVFAGVLR